VECSDVGGNTVARDICYEEHCWGWETSFFGWTPVKNKKLTVWVDEKCISTLSDDDKIKFLRKIREYYGFSQLIFYPSHERNEQMLAAGWMKDQIVVQATGSNLNDLQYEIEFWNNAWNAKEREKQIADPAYIPKKPPLFPYVFYDEPWKVRNNTILFWDFIGKDIIIPPHYPSYITSGFLVDFCHNVGKYSDLFNNDPLQRFFLMSLFIHKCMNSEFVFGAFNTSWNNNWEDIVELNRLEYVVEGENSSQKWVDSILYQGYHYTRLDFDQSPEWRLLDSAGMSGKRGVISLSADYTSSSDYEFLILFDTANDLGYNEIMCFPQEVKTPEWSTCEEYEKRLAIFCNAAAAKGFLQRNATYQRKCVQIEIPGCKEGLYDPRAKYDPYYDPLLSFNPWKKETFFP